MTSWIWDTDEVAPAVDDNAHTGEDPALIETSYVAGPIGPAQSAQQVTTKIPPTYNGSSLWFTYEEAVWEWADLTELSKRTSPP